MIPMRALVLGFTALAFTTAQAQFQSSNVTLYKQFTLAQLGASSGNSCWGYVSPSGREYAIMGCSNKAAFVEITLPFPPISPVSPIRPARGPTSRPMVARAMSAPKPPAQASR